MSGNQDNCFQSEEKGNIKVSVIVPSYNSEKYIEKCLNSLVRQTLKEIEIIVVDDGSIDNTVKIVEDFCKKDSRIKLIKQEHLMQGAARNNGTAHSSGEYIGFIDSDDWVDLNYFKKLYEAAKRYNSDIALATNVRIGNGKTKKRLNIEKEQFVSEMQEKFDICKLLKNPCPTNKIYKKNLFTERNIKWPEGCYCEDKLFVVKAVYYSNGVVCVPDINYYYYRNPTSTVNNKTKVHLEKVKKDKDDSKKAVLNFLRENNVQIRDKEFWAVTERKMFINIPFLVKKESLHTKRYYLFSFLKIKEEAI